VYTASLEWANTDVVSISVALENENGSGFYLCTLGTGATGAGSGSCSISVLTPGYYTAHVGRWEYGSTIMDSACIEFKANATATPITSRTPYPTQTPYPTHTPYPTYYPFISPLNPDSYPAVELTVYPTPRFTPAVRLKW
jgi:hypothetical protein